jgi:neutral ceramidase
MMRGLSTGVWPWLCLAMGWLTCGWLTCGPVAGGEPAGWRAGVARGIITPTEPVWLAGYGTKRVPEGTLHDLWLKVLAIEDGDGRRGVLITSDFQGVPRSMSDPVFEQLQRRYGLERHQVLFTFSHNHCGPRLGDDLVDYYPVEAEQVELVARYTERMQAEVVELVGLALAAMEPAELAYGRGETSFAVNRRENPESEVPRLLDQGAPLKGPVDHSVPVLSVRGVDGRLRAVLFGYACHPTTLSFNHWCGDYPGFAQLAIEAAVPGATAMFVNTCGGDQNPLPRRSVELCERYGQMLADAALGVLVGPLQPIGGGLRSEFAMIDLPYEQVASEALLRRSLEDSSSIKRRWAARLLEQLERGEVFSDAYPYPLHAWRLGDELLMIGMGAETVVDYALRFKQQYGEGTWVLGYTDDMAAYIPSRRVWLEGGYEGGAFLYEYGRPALRWGPEIEQSIAAAVERLVNNVTEKETGSFPDHN